MLAAAIETNAPAATLKTRERVVRQLQLNSVNRLIEKPLKKSNPGINILANPSFVLEKGPSVTPPPLHGQCRGIGKTRINVKTVRFFLFRNLSSERQVKAPKTSVF
jgi:hypothetical protein